MTTHSTMTGADIHGPISFNFSSATERSSATNPNTGLAYTSSDIGSQAWQTDDDSFYVLKTITPTWATVGGGGGGSGNTIYNSDSVIDSVRNVTFDNALSFTGLNSSQYKVVSYDLTQSDSTNIGSIDLSPFGAEIGFIKEDGSGIFVFQNSVTVTENGVKITTGNDAGMFFDADYSANYTARSIVDKAYVDEHGAGTQVNAVTGIVSGGFITLDSGGNTNLVDISSGNGYIVDYQADPENPSITFVNWNGVISYAVSLLTDSTYFIGFDIAGSIVSFDATVLTGDDLHDYIFVGSVTVYGGTVTDIVIAPLTVGMNGIESFRDFSRTVIGASNIHGNVISGNAGTLTLSTTGGTYFILGSNFRSDANSPDLSEVLADASFGFLKVLRGPNGDMISDGGGTIPLLDPTSYDNDTGAKVPVPVGSWTVQVVYITESGRYQVAYGQELFNNKSDAISAVEQRTISYDERDTLSHYVLRSLIVVSQSATDLSDKEQAVFLEAGSFRGAGLKSLSGTFYLTDGEIESDRTVTIKDEAGLSFEAYDTDAPSWSFKSNLFTQSRSFLAEIQTGDGAGGVLTTQSFSIASSGMLITDTENLRGLEYAADYSVAFTDRSLVDKAYVDANGNNNIYDSDGNIQSSRTVQGFNNVSLAFHMYNSVGNSNWTEKSDLVLESTFADLNYREGDGGGSTSGIAGIKMSASGIVVTDTAQLRGMVYAADYSANYTDRTLVDKAYVDANGGNNALNNTTGLLSGGVITNAGSGRINVTAGTGIVVNTSDPENIVTTNISWNAKNAYMVQNINNDGVYYIGFNASNNNTIVEISVSNLMPKDLRDYIMIGNVSLSNGSIVNVIGGAANLGYNSQSHEDFVTRLIGPATQSGLIFSAFSTNMTLSYTSGVLFGTGLNFRNSKTEPNLLNVTGASPAFGLVLNYRDGTGEVIAVVSNTVDPSMWDDGSGVLQSVGNNKYTIQRIFIIPSDSLVANVFVSYGQEVFSSLTAAKDALGQESFTEDNGLPESWFRSSLILKNNASDLSDITQAIFTTAPKFRLGGVSGGSGGGGSGTNIYNADGALTGNRAITTGGFNLSLMGSGYFATGGNIRSGIDHILNDNNAGIANTANGRVLAIDKNGNETLLLSAINGQDILQVGSFGAAPLTTIRFGLGSGASEVLFSQSAYTFNDGGNNRDFIVIKSGGLKAFSYDSGNDLTTFNSLVEYSNDFSSTFNNRSFVDKEYVDLTFSAYPSMISGSGTPNIEQVPSILNFANIEVNESGTDYTIDFINDRFVFDNNANLDKVYEIHYSIAVSVTDQNNDARGSIRVYAEVTTDAGATITYIEGSESYAYLREDANGDANTRTSVTGSFMIKPTQDNASVQLWIAKGSTINCQSQAKTFTIKRVK